MTQHHTEPSPSSDDLRWARVVARQPAHGEVFYYAVTTTGIYCHPTCGARRPKRSNVRFFDSPASAEQAGFRPCKRCRPQHPDRPGLHEGLVTELCQWIRETDVPPNLKALAAKAQMSPFHLHRVFKKVTGLTPHRYARAVRQARVQRTLASATTVTEAVFAAGYNSSAPFYAEATEFLGMPPKARLGGGKDMAISFGIADCSLGKVLVATSELGICAVLLADHADPLLDDLKQRFPRASVVQGDASLSDALQQVVAYIDNPGGAVDLPLDVRGTVFQQRVWNALREIPAGATASYSEIAKRLGDPNAARAVGRACGANPLAVLIPCHRAVSKSGSLTGYRWSLGRKQQLLDRERTP